MSLGRQFALALAIATIARPGTAAGPPPTLTLDGEARFRSGDFDGPRRSFAAATDADPTNARAWWGRGRVEQISFRRDAARDLFAKAYRLDPQDTDVILSYLEFVDHPD